MHRLIWQSSPHVIILSAISASPIRAIIPLHIATSIWDDNVSSLPYLSFGAIAPWQRYLQPLLVFAYSLHWFNSRLRIAIRTMTLLQNSLIRLLRSKKFCQLEDYPLDRFNQQCWRSTSILKTQSLESAIFPSHTRSHSWFRCDILRLNPALISIASLF